MAYALHYRFSFGGNLFGADGSTVQDIWACNVNVTPSSGNTMDEDSYLADVAPNMATWFSSSASGNSTQSSLEYLKLNQIGTDGRYVNRTAAHTFDYGTPARGGQSPVDPEIISIATSWVTSIKRGPGARGRIYLPNATYTGAGQMLIPQAAQDLVVAAGKRLLQVINNGNGGSGLPPQGSNKIVAIPVVASDVNASNTNILGLRVGNVKDVQRRRKNAIVESYRSGIFLALAD